MLVHFVEERVFVVKTAHIPLLLNMIDVHLHVQTLIQLLPRYVIRRPRQLGVPVVALEQPHLL